MSNGKEHAVSVALSGEERDLFDALLEEEGIALSQSEPFARRVKSDAVPLSFAQQRLWFLHQFDPASPVYNLPSAVRFEGRLDVEALARTLDQIVSRHESLRTTFANEAGQPVQVVAPSLS